MPAQAGVNQRSWLTPLVQADQRSDGNGDMSADEIAAITPMDAWWKVEDLWTRLAACMAMSVQNDGDAFRIVLHRFRHLWGGDAVGLRMAAMEMDTFRWETPDGKGSFVRLIDYVGDDLVLLLPSIHQIERWPDGDDLVWQVKGYLLRLRGMTDNQAVST